MLEAELWCNKNGLHFLSFKPESFAAEALEEVAVLVIKSSLAILMEGPWVVGTQSLCKPYCYCRMHICRGKKIL